MPKIDTFCEKYADRVVWELIAGFIIIFSYLVILQYSSFSYQDWDFASEANIMWNTVNGRPFYYSFMQQVIFGYHLFLVSVLIAPIYAVFQHPVTLLILQTIFLGLAAYPLYLLARLKIGRSLALAVSFAYLLYPTIGYIALFETHFEVYVIFFLFYALYFFEKEKFAGFIGFVFLALLCKENVSLVIFMLGVYGFLRRRSAKWVLWPMALGAGWFILATKVVIPYFAKDRQLYPDGFMFAIYYEHLGRNIFEMFHTLITQPGLIARTIFTKAKIIYLVRVFAPGGFLALFSPASLLITLPVFMQNLLSLKPSHFSIMYHYLAMAIPFIFFSMVNTFRKILNYQQASKIRGVIFTGFLVVVIVSAFLLAAPQMNLHIYSSFYGKDEFTGEQQKIAGLVPPDAPVISTFKFLPRLSQRKDVYSMHFVFDGRKMYSSEKYDLPEGLEYALIDFNDMFILNLFFPPEAPGNIRNFLKEGEWGVLTGSDDTILFNKDIQSRRRLFEEVDHPLISHPLNIDLNGEVIFLGYDLIPESSQGGSILHLVYYWKRLKDIPGNLGILVEFVDNNNQVKLNKPHVVGYRVFPLEAWKENKVFKEHHYLFLPGYMHKERYNICAEVLYLPLGRKLPVVSGDKVDSNKRIMLTDSAVWLKDFSMGK